MVVVAISALLLAWGIPAFSTWNSRHTVEAEIAQLFSDLQYARMSAYGSKNLTGIYWGGGASMTQYTIMTNMNANATTIDIGATQAGGAVNTSKYPLTLTPSQNSVSFDGRGLLYTGCANDTATQITFYISPDYGAGTDCVSVTLTRILSGKWNGTTCNPR